VPLRLKGEVLGVLNINDPEDGKAFGTDDLFVAQVVANQAAVAIWNGQLRDATVAAAEAHRDLDVAREIQQSFIPEDLRAPGVEVAGRSIACSGAGGDYVDYWMRRDAEGRETGEVVLVIGDVSGHGVGAALMMATTRAFLRGLLSQSHDLPVVLRRLNELLGADVRAGRFVTLFVGVLDPGCRRLAWASAGHDPPLHHRPAEGATTALEATGPPLGVLPEAEFPCATTALSPGDLLVLTTDGAWEVRDAAGECWGRERLAEALADLAAESPHGVLAGLRRRIAGFAGTVDPSDDISLVVARIAEAPASPRREGS
jgi:serine phosphatase RsbU (regulator of sigma subunit)